MTQIFNARILASIAMLVFVGAIVASSTGAFFSDTETSTGNTFTAGDIDLKIDNTSYVTSTSTGLLVASPANSWQLSDLTNQLFFSFIDLKPGDIGEDTISLHPGTNSAYACMKFNMTGTPENTVTEPEVAALDNASSTVGELQNYLEFQFWNDDGDNVFETGETVISSLTGLASSIFTNSWLTIADSGSGTPLAGGSTKYIGKAWCFGDLASNGTAQDGNGSSTPLTRGTGFTCNGAGNQNNAQTDGIAVDVSFQAIQTRNNGQFLCSSLNETPTPQTGTVTLDKIVTFTNQAIAGVDVSDYTLHLVGPGGDHVLVDEVAFPGLTPGAYVVSEVYSGNPAGVSSNATFTGSCTEIGTTNTATFNVVSGVNPTCTITNSVATST